MIKSLILVIGVVIVIGGAFSVQASADALTYVCDLGIGRVREIHADENYVYIGTDGSGIGIYDKSDWSQVWYEPDWPGVDGLRTYSMGQELVGTDYYVARWEPGVFHYDVTDPTNPVLVDRWCDTDVYEEIKGVAYHNGYIYAREVFGIHVLDADDLAAGPVISDTWTGGAGGITAYVHNDYLFVPSYHFVRVYDISDPGGLEYVTSFGEGTIGEFYGDYYIAARTYRQDKLFEVYDISDIDNITLAYEWRVGDDELVCQGKGVDIQGNYMYVTDCFEGIFVFDITDILNPVLVDHVQVNSELAEGVLADGDFLYVGGTSDGGMVYTINSIPEPATLIIAIAGFTSVGCVFVRRRINV